ncbi:MAG TPA: BTAD domain-containing putative transcriptional regulator, partial [Longimicrobium sp.]|nr:BTAD domain-containing putative transcriptional regulator [Longimicrobium sp.]
MYTLNLLGGAGFHGRNGAVSGRAAHRRRVALLAILAVARGRTVGRERIIGLLWPEHRTDAARHLLSESLYVLRKELGDDAFVSAGDEVGLNAATLLSDVDQFEGAVAAGNLERAASFYRGPFLDGFFLSDAPEFERWAEGERARLAALHARALECLAAALEREGRPHEAAEWWRRLAVLDPYNSRVGIRLMSALDAAGERAAALWFAERHVALLRDELGVEPQDDFAALVNRLRNEPVRVPPSPAYGPAPGPGSASGAVAETAKGAEVAEVAEVAGGGEAVRVDGGGPARDEEGDEEAARAAAFGEAAGEGGVRGETTPGAPSPAGVARPADAAPAAPPAPCGPPEGAGPGPVAESPRAPPRCGARRAMAPLHLASAAGLLLGVAGALAYHARERPAAPAPAGYDPRRVAVLYFDDYSQGGELGYLANGLTEALIHDLAQVRSLQVISRNGVKPYRERAVRFDSLAADLRAGSVVEGSVQRSGDSVRVTVQLVDANTGAQLESRTLVHPVTSVFALEDALADSVSAFLRRRVGQEVELRRTRAETTSPLAWQRLLEAEQARDEAARLVEEGEEGDARAAEARLRHADSLLAAAERDDPAWTRPTVLRGWVALQRPGPGAEASALAFAGRVLAREPGHPQALELRGSAYLRGALSTTDSAARERGLTLGERDLRAAVARDPTLATAWNRLSLLVKYRGHPAESDALARRALREDAYLADADDILSRLYFTALYAADYREARSLCAQGHGRFPRDWRFVECQLTLLRADTSRPADPAAAVALLRELARMDPPDRARRAARPYSPLFRQAVAAGVLARAGQNDSARAMLARARAAAGSDPELRLSLAYDEAYVYLALGRADS